MDSTPTPGWMVGLLVIFSLATAATFGLFLYRHAEKAALLEKQTQLKFELRELRGHEGNLASAIAPLENQITSRRVLRASLIEQDNQASDDITRMVTQNQANVKIIEEKIAQGIKTYVDVLKEAKERRLELALEEERAEKEERKADEQRAALRARIEVISQEIEAVKKKGRAENAVLDSRIVQLEDRVRELTQQREQSAKDLRPDGQILQAAATDGFVILNIGQRHNLRKGTRFSVYTRRAGKVKMKGVIEVMRIEEQISTARVLEETDKNDPLLVNDFIANPVYNPEKVKGFAVRGDFTRYSKDELRRIIEENGGRYDSELTVNTDYLVAGERSDEALQQAVKLGISILSEEQLIESQLFRLPDGQKQ